MLTAFADAVMQRVIEIIVGPVADPRLHVGRDVRGGDRAERGRHVAPAGEFLAVMGGVA
jgi:hypothetical protein